MLEFVYESDTIQSRLACQVIVTDDLDGLIVRMPESQLYPINKLFIETPSS